MTSASSKPSTITISRQQAVNFLLRHHGLNQAPSVSSWQTIDQVFQHLRAIQFDPLKPCGNNVDLVLQSRLRDIHPGDYANWLYQRRQGVEYFDKVLCLLPIEDLPYTYAKRLQIAQNPRLKQFVDRHSSEMVAIIQRIDQTGPISSQHIIDDRIIDWSWSQARWGRAALEALWETGQVVVSYRKQGRKYYDLPAKVYGQAYNSLGSAVIDHGHILRRLQSTGFLPASGAGTGWLGLTPGPLKQQAIKQAVQSGQAQLITIEGLAKPFIIQTKHLDQLQNSPNPQQSLQFIAPLDNFIWDRLSIKALFKFDYKWEVYTPALQRRFGYYALPMLYGSQLIGRIEPVFKEGQLIINNKWLEQGVVWDKHLRAAYQQAVEQFAAYLQTQVIIDRSQ